MPSNNPQLHAFYQSVAEQLKQAKLDIATLDETIKFGQDAGENMADAIAKKKELEAKISRWQKAIEAKGYKV